MVSLYSLSLVLSASVILSSCGKAADMARTETASSAAQPSVGIAPRDTMGASLSSANTRILRWIVGTWKGTGDVPVPFYERYDLLNDSTLRVLNFTDSTLVVTNDTTIYGLRSGRFANHDRPRRYVAKVLDDSHVEFVPVNANNSFIWAKQSDSSWLALIIPVPTNPRNAQRTYTMTRYRR